MFNTNLIDAIRLPFRKEKELYRSFHSILGFYPRNINFYQEALMHSSMLAKSEKGKPLNNERLEFLGDAILDAIVGEIVYHHFPKKQEGFLTNARSKIVKRETLGQVAVQLGLDRLVHSNAQVQPHCHNSYMAGNAFEAIIGAIYLDRGYHYCKKFMQERILGQLINIEKIAYQETNFKSKLIEWSQKRKIELEFVNEEERDEKGIPIFSCKVSLAGMQLGEGNGFSKKESQQMASKLALQKLRRGSKVYETLMKTKVTKPE